MLLSLHFNGFSGEKKEIVEGGGSKQRRCKHLPEIVVSQKFCFSFYYNQIQRLKINHFLSHTQNLH